MPLTALILGYMFLLKMMSHMQSRLGPMDPGGFHGWYQLVGDGVKFMQKEDIMPAEADRRVFALAPAVVVLSTFLVFVVIPAGPAARRGAARRRRVLHARGVEPVGDRRVDGGLGERQQVRVDRRAARRRPAHRLRAARWCSPSSAW